MQYCRSGHSMKLNEKNVASFATCSSPIDKEGYLEKRGDFSKNFQRRWFVLKGNLLFYFEKKQDKEPLGLIVLEACSVQVSSQAKHAFEISFDGQGSRVYVMTADNDEDMQSWIKVISHASYEYMRSIVDELQRRVNLLTSSSKLEQEAAASGMSQLHVGPARKVAPQQRQLTSSSSGAEKRELGATARIENGILVDVSEETATPPPIPKKMKHHARTGLGSGEDHSYRDTSLAPSSPPTVRQMVQATPGAFSSPYTLPPRLNPSRPLSPAATLDRTCILQPTTLPNSPLSDTELPRNLPPPLLATATSSDTAISSSPSSSSQQLASHAKGFEVLGKTSSTVSASTARPRQVSAAPLDSNKSVFELHEDFTRALGALHNSKNS